MKKAKSRKNQRDKDGMRREYDFSGQKGVRGKYYRAYRNGHTVRIREDNGNVTVQHFTLADGAVILEPDVQAYFPNSESVNKTLRSIIAMVRGDGSPRRTLSRSPKRP